MRNRWQYFLPVGAYLGLLLWCFGILMLVPLCVWAAFASAGRAEVSAAAYWVPALAALLGGLALKRNLRNPPLDTRRAMILCALGWIVISFVGALPFYIGLEGVSFLDAYFETVSGFTTTGITVLTGLDDMAPSILFWRSFIQWLGGLGILTFFLAILYTGGSAHRLFGAESHKVFSRRPAPGLFNTLRILWLIYFLLTAATVVALRTAGVARFDAFSHAMTALSTGGYSPHEASVAWFRDSPGVNAVAAEYILIAGMLMGGMSFMVHFRVFRGGIRALWDSLEMRLWWLILALATGVVMVSHNLAHGTWGDLHDLFRDSLFQVVSILTTTGFATRDIASDYFGSGGSLIFLMLMVIGGCVGSTAGGIKVLRIGILLKMITRQVRRLTYGPAAVQPLIVDGEIVGDEEVRRAAALFFGWIALLVFGALVTALLPVPGAQSAQGPLAAASGMFSALGNIGPCFIETAEMARLHWGVKIVYILGMLAGRLEILPLLLLISPRTWR